MTVKEFYEYMCRELPIEWACEGDCDGMSCCPDADIEVERVLIALDATEAVIDEASRRAVRSFWRIIRCFSAASRRSATANFARTS